ncbi:putative O-methyltransferase YrrM [Catalinimonas alkaloidigena]|uniref:class I SAM-dependent methyltransferase n=1 Tax=Catalinimonas alkaloidigena TaxID=1075417 RepID=UPI00240724A3|nr:class I SAM-dependent methyltransferase [Catalinimonas alkaloidigena]MDF9795206.1 putative O-methyltransferase YrrM [Catalinimonas alkaloidigena]
MMNSFLTRVSQSIQQSEQFGLLSDNKNLSGYSGKKLVGVLQRLSNTLIDEDECYLEIGVFQGLTLLSVALALEDRSAYGIDNFAFFDPEGKNFGTVKERIQHLQLKNAFVINEDYEDAMETLPKHVDKKVKVFFIDGPHDYRSQLMCLLLSIPYLADDAVIIIDDCNYKHVRQANRDFLITHPEFKMIFEAYTSSHPANMSDEEKKTATEGWWNGVNIIVKDTANKIDPMYPPTERSRTVFENEHLLHAKKYPLRQLEYARLLQAYDSFDVKKIINLNLKLYRERNFIRSGEIVGKYTALNTYSDSLPKARYNTSIDRS